MSLLIFYIQWLIFLLNGNTMKKYHAQKILQNTRNESIARRRTASKESFLVTTRHRVL
jgi:hypothetical protein